MLTFVLTVLLFFLLIFPHELGHFIVAKAVGVQVNEFSIGMGPSLYQKQGKETKYSLRAIPLGGYCAMEGENDESENPRAFNNKSWWKKILVLLAGATMNVLVAVLAMLIALSVTGITTNVIETVTEDGPAAIAGMIAGDEITEIDGVAIENFNDVANAIDSSEGNSLEVKVERNGTIKTLNMSPLENEDGRYLVGIESKLNHSPLVGVRYCLPATWNMNVSLIKGFKELLTGGVSADDISGPVGIVKLVGDSSEYGFTYFLYLASLISLNIAIINLLPLPALDGGRIIFVIIRGITGNMITDKMEGTVHTVGMMLLLLLFVLITWNDIVNLFN
ncbi:MAG: RIP metalloprotease RseP [Peptostreptococcaceae bacterium]|nr:RIP metalloprotease RseP [Peptostreptococcaceae bacterium]